MDTLTDTFQILRGQLLARQPHSERALESLTNRLAGRPGCGAFAPIEHGCCSACRVRVAAVLGAAADAGEFITCPSCSRFLYRTPKGRAAAEE